MEWPGGVDFNETMVKYKMVSLLAEAYQGLKVL
jgi:hypothetical protein